jgi:hypothetical protein
VDDKRNAVKRAAFRQRLEEETAERLDEDHSALQRKSKLRVATARALKKR